MGDVFILQHDNTGNVVPAKCDNYRRLKMFEYASGNLKYLCRNTNIDAEETDGDWDVWKFTDADLPTIEGPRTGAVNTEGVVDAFNWKT
jgi:hypothetical protein